MPLKKYRKILRSLNFQNNDEYDPNDRFYKIQLFFNKRTGINGQVFDILPYGGERIFTNIQFTDYENKYFGLGGKVILGLASTIPRKPLSVIYHDNFFIPPELIYHLRKKYGILSLSIVQQIA
jgi:hypothetical protein